jgi:signal transduction histidine kinase
MARRSAIRSDYTNRTGTFRSCERARYGRTISPSRPHSSQVSLAPTLLVRRWPERRPIVLGSSALLLASVVAANLAAGGTALGVLSIVPVLLVALELGLWGGLASGALAGLLLNVAGTLDAGEVAIQTLALATVAAVAGRFSDRMRGTHDREQRLLDSGLAVGATAAVEDLPGVVARAACGVAGAEGVTVELAGAPTARVGRLSGTSTSVAIVARDAALGRIELVHDARLVPEDRAALELLARQAAIAADNHRLREREHEAVAIEAELRRVRDDLLEQRSGLGHLLDAEEEERRRVAERLHEDLAQVLAAVLLGLRMLRRDPSAPKELALEDLHAQVVRVLGDVRDVAASLRPFTLGELGLLPALEALAGRLPWVKIEAHGVPDDLPEPLQLAVYRLVEQAFAAGEPGASATASLRADGDALHVTVTAPCRELDVVVAGARARVALLGGSLVGERAAGGTTMRIRLPLP